MSYEIPHSLQYKEKIVFGLTLEQLIHAVVFGLLAFLLYVKLPFSFAGSSYWPISLLFAQPIVGLFRNNPRCAAKPSLRG